MSSGQITIVEENHSYWITCLIFKKAVGNYDLTVHANFLGPNNLSNFFGLGNNTENIDYDFDDQNIDREDGISIIGNRYNYLNADIRLGRNCY